MKTTIQQSILRIEKKHPNDPAILKELDEIEVLLSKNLEETIACLNELSENEISWISPCFEAISTKFKSQRFIICLNELVKKYPGIEYLQKDVQEAIDVVK